MQTFVEVEDSTIEAVETICRLNKETRSDVMKRALVNGVLSILKEIHEDKEDSYSDYELRQVEESIIDMELDENSLEGGF